MCIKCNDGGYMCAVHPDKAWNFGACCGTNNGRVCECHPMYADLMELGMPYASVAAVIDANGVTPVKTPGDSVH